MGWSPSGSKYKLDGCHSIHIFSLHFGKKNYKPNGSYPIHIFIYKCESDDLLSGL